jgi:RNA-directed DNA polymerase
VAFLASAWAAVSAASPARVKAADGIASAILFASGGRISVGPTSVWFVGLAPMPAVSRLDSNRKNYRHTLPVSRPKRPRIPDRRVLRLIRSYLTAGVLNNGLFEASRVGTPQGGPPSPLLSNLVLDELDRDLERRGHRFVRYADDCNIYVRSEKAGHRVMTSLTRFIEGRLKLQVNAQKSAWHRSFLGFTVTDEPQPRRRIAEKAVARFKDRVRALTRRHRGVTLERMIAELNPLLRGVGRLLRLQPMARVGLTGRLDTAAPALRRMGPVEDGKTRGRRYKELRRLRVSDKVASAAIFSPKGPWRLSSASAMHGAFNNKRFKDHGLFSMETVAGA